MISRETMIEALLEVAPSFRPTWDEFARRWADEPELPLYVVLEDFAQQTITAMRDGDVTTLKAVLALVERWLLEGDDYVREAATIGFLEDLQNTNLHDTTRPEDFVPLLGSQARLQWDKLNLFWEKGTIVRDD